MHVKIIVLLFIQHVTKTASTTGADGQCVMYDHCGNNPDITWAKLNCLNSGPPRKVDDPSSYALLQKFCPELVSESGDQLCCGPQQIEDLANNLALPEAILAKCPSCYYNFRQIFCGITCSPNQFQFMRAKEIVHNKEGKPMVKSLEVFVKDVYVNSTYKSCKEVTLNRLNAPAMDLLCGPWGAADCSPHKWFDYMGSTSNGFAPFDIIYKYVKHDDNDLKIIKPFHFPTFLCSETVDPRNSSARCSCQDCQDSCPIQENIVGFLENKETFSLA